MYIPLDTLILLGSAAGVVATLIGVILKAHKWYLKVEALEKEVADLKRHHEKDIDRMKNENKLICEALSACLDGLSQLGANHTVPTVKKKLDDHLNEEAHH